MSSFHHRIKSGRKGSAAAHARYIARIGSFSDRDDLVESNYGNMPDWAQENPIDFWRAADTFERSNGAVYREHEIALPIELDEEQNRRLVDELVRELAGTKPYQYAVHMPEGKLGGTANPHLHLMFSDRAPDGISRPADRMFARYNSLNPELGGRRKHSGGRTRMEIRDDLIATRKTIADIQNRALAEHGFDERVDHRSLKEQGRERTAERHLGPARVRYMSDEEKAQFSGLRQSSKS